MPVRPGSGLAGAAGRGADQPGAAVGRRIPTLRLAAGVDQIPLKNNAVIYGAYELPVTW